MTSTKRKEATRRGPGGRVEWTNATDENGILVPLSAHDTERLGAEGVREYKERREQQIAEQEARRREQDDRKRFEEAFVEAGGNKNDAAAAYKAHRNEQAARAASAADTEAIRRTRSRVRSRL